MNPIEKLLTEVLTAGPHSHDERTKEGIEAAMMKHISMDKRVSGESDPNVAFEKVVACKIQNPEFAKALSTISTAILQIFPVTNNCPLKKAAAESAEAVDPSSLN